MADVAQCMSLDGGIERRRRIEEQDKKQQKDKEKNGQQQAQPEEEEEEQPEQQEEIYYQQQLQKQTQQLPQILSCLSALTAPPKFNRSVRRKQMIAKMDVCVENVVCKLAKSSRFLQEVDDRDEYIGDYETSNELPIFHRNEIKTSTLLGTGAFSEVYQIHGFKPYATTTAIGEVDENEEHGDGEAAEVGFDPVQERKRDDIITSSIDERTGKCRYALKHLRPEFLNHKKKFQHAGADLVLEAMYLSKLNHPNILKIRGWAGGPSAYREGTHDGFFLILDRIDETLSHRIMRWIMAERKVSPTNNKSGNVRKIDNKNDFTPYGEKLKIAAQIARGLDYLHSHDIIFRDLKPDNVGLKGGRVQIFDFGLCRELPEERPEPDKTFHMSGVGTRIFMAPEVLVGQQYNLKADVYSWTMVFHTMLSHRKPFDAYGAAEHKVVVCQRGVRPPINSDWPTKLQLLCKKGWANSPLDRPTMKQVAEMVENMHGSVENALTTPAEAPDLIDTLTNVMDFCSNMSLCGGKETKDLNKKAINLLRFLEAHMVDGMNASVRGRHDARNNSNVQHLRSHYL